MGILDVGRSEESELHTTPQAGISRFRTLGSPHCFSSAPVRHNRNVAEGKGRGYPSNPRRIQEFVASDAMLHRYVSEVAG